MLRILIVGQQPYFFDLEQFPNLINTLLTTCKVNKFLRHYLLKTDENPVESTIILFP